MFKLTNSITAVCGFLFFPLATRKHMMLKCINKSRSEWCLRGVHVSNWNISSFVTSASFSFVTNYVLNAHFVDTFFFFFVIQNLFQFSFFHRMDTKKKRESNKNVPSHRWTNESQFKFKWARRHKFRFQFDLAKNVKAIKLQFCRLLNAWLGTRQGIRVSRNIQEELEAHVIFIA